ARGRRGPPGSGSTPSRGRTASPGRPSPRSSGADTARAAPRRARRRAARRWTGGLRSRTSRVTVSAVPKTGHIVDSARSVEDGPEADRDRRLLDQLWDLGSQAGDQRQPQPVAAALIAG